MKRLVEQHDQWNRECAQIILADIGRYGGEDSLMTRWARLVLNPPAERTTPKAPTVLRNDTVSSNCLTGV